MAFSVLIYHYTSWSNFNLLYPFDQTISRLGIYAVCAFYVISGASLALVYYNKTVNMSFLKEFTLKRLFRIAPLFYFVTTVNIVLTIIYNFLKPGVFTVPDMKTILLNYTLTFGWLSPTSYIATGAWSIGNELVFYSFFPIMLLLIKKSKKLFIIFVVLALFSSFYISEILMNSNNSFESQWALYINPLNQLYWFIGGFIMGYLFKMGFRVNHLVLLILAICSILIFVIFPTEGADDIVYVTGSNKVIFSIIIFTLGLFATFWGNIKESVITRVLKDLGDVSYSVYLIHPIVYQIVKFLLGIISLSNALLIMIVSVIGTLISSTMVYYLIEKPFIKIGKRITSKKEISIP